MRHAHLHVCPCARTPYTHTQARRKKEQLRVGLQHQLGFDAAPRAGGGGDGSVSGGSVSGGSGGLYSPYSQAPSDDAPSGRSRSVGRAMQQAGGGGGGGGGGGMLASFGGEDRKATQRERQLQ